MRRFTVQRGLRLLLAAGLCLSTLAAAGAAGQPEKPVFAQAAEPVPTQAAAESIRVPETVEPIWLPEEALRQEWACALLSEYDLTQQQAEALCIRMGADAALLRMLDQGELTPADLTWLALPNSRTDRLERYGNWAEQYPEDEAEAVVLWVNMDRDLAFYDGIQGAEDPDSLTVLVNKHYALSSDYEPELEVLGKNYGSGSLRPEAAQAFRAMADAAGEDGVSLHSVSAYRSYQQQKSTYNLYARQYKQSSADNFSARPGHSEHQTGLALDINSARTRARFENTEAFAWLKEHCAEYGFILRYGQDKTDITGYRFEPWHYRYVGVEIAQACMSQGLAYEEYLALLPG